MEERILNRLDCHDKSLGDHCVRLTTLEQDHKNRDKNSSNRITYLLVGIVVLEFLFIMVDKIT